MIPPWMWIWISKSNLSYLDNIKCVPYLTLVTKLLFHCWDFSITWTWNQIWNAERLEWLIEVILAAGTCPQHHKESLNIWVSYPLPDFDWYTVVNFRVCPSHQFNRTLSSISTVPFRPTLRSQVTATLEEKTSTICHRSQRRSKRWTEIFGAWGAPFIAYYQLPKNLFEEMDRMSHLISGIEETLISSWRSQVTRGEE